MILVTSANGNQGTRLVPKLLEAGHHVRACVQSSASADRLRARGVEDVVVGDLADPAVVARVVRDIESVSTLVLRSTPPSAPSASPW